MNWKISLDRYLTTPPDDGFDGYFDQIVESFTEKFWDEHENWILDSKDFQTLVENCFNKGRDPKYSSKIIERAFNIYHKPQLIGKMARS